VKFVTIQNGVLRQFDPHASAAPKHITTDFGSSGLNTLMPGLALGAIHELLHEDNVFPLFFASLLVQITAQKMPAAPRFTVWCDPFGSFYPPAVQELGLDLSRLYLLRPRSELDEIAMIGECLVCQSVGAVVAPLGRLTQVQARRLQLAAERGGGVGILIRPAGQISSIYAAASRWLVSPAPGERTLQRWKVELLHGRGGQVGQSVYLEYCRETHTLHTSSQLANRPLPSKRAIA
jgi:protein ImuA